jgi:hypothetical protein
MMSSSVRWMRRVERNSLGGRQRGHRNRAMIGFPFGLFWLSRIALLAPEPLRRLVMRFFRFHMDA